MRVGPVRRISTDGAAPIGWPCSRVHPRAPPYPFTPNLISSGREEPDAAPSSPPPAVRRSLPEATPAASRSSEAGPPRKGRRRSGPTAPAPPPPDAARSSTARRCQLQRTNEVLPRPPPQGASPALRSAAPRSGSPPLHLPSLNPQ
ncbi:hypothetical protein BDA96_10G131400 [Sorghum bicolor]|uniref:Uncharacterized protein n=1 Tax=Sorghum bicolor TaxID=4558 RepID=A0A921Q2V3_SORBI|nr:hypothetical protein BDA96_10G131400 [Sorghum bicolor]